MANTLDPSVREIASSRPKLSDELVISPQVHGGETYCHIEVPSRGKFYRVGYSEYVFLSLLDGRRTVAQALTITARMLGTEALTQPEGIHVTQWLIENRLAWFTDEQSRWCPSDHGPGGSPRHLFKGLNPFWMKFSFGSPDRFLSAILPSVGWLFSAWAMFAGIAVIGFGVSAILTRWTQFIASADGVLAPHNWLWMMIAWLFLKIVHELSHAMACKVHGGEVRDTGAIFVLMAPMAYVDVTSCWRFPSRWQRIHVAAAGMYSELVIAAIAAIAWGYVESSVVQHLLFNLIAMASLSTVLFNANPLMRFDGYYILTDLLKIPNLASDGNRFLKQWSSDIFFGEKAPPMQILGARRWVVGAYGIASAAWRLVVCVSLVTVASVLLHGAGLSLAIFGMVSWFGIPIYKLGMDLQRRLHEKRSSFVRAALIGTGVAATSTVLVMWVPWPGVMKAPVVVDYSDRSVVRSTAAGFVKRVHVVDGQTVQEGQLLLELDNDELQTQRDELEIGLQQASVRHRVAVGQQQGAEAQIAERNRQAIEERLIQIRRQTGGLQVRAPVSGRIVARNLEQTLGTYIQEGAEILTVADEARKELIVSVGQQEIDRVMARIGERTRFRVSGRLARTGILDHVDPRASTALPHPAMSAAVGGPLAVIGERDEDASDRRLVESRFRGIIALSPKTCQSFGAGEQGYAILGLRRESIGEYAFTRLRRWLETLLRPA